MINRIKELIKKLKIRYYRKMISNNKAKMRECRRNGDFKKSFVYKEKVEIYSRKLQAVL